MSDGRDQFAFVMHDRHYILHKPGRVVTRRFGQVEKLAGSIHQYRRGKWPVWLAKLDLGINDVFHLRMARVGQNTSIAQRSRTPLGPALKPADYLSSLESIHGTFE